MGSRLGVYPLAGRTTGHAARQPAWRRRIAPVLVALICILMAVAAVTVARPDVDAPAVVIG
jgi:hypothetical protein